MSIAAVICECNPCHRGHRYIFQRARQRSDTVIAILSGNFVQRAEPALFDLYTRAEAVLRCGVDLVVELPFPWSSASAEYFASAGVSLAAAMGADTLVFGAASEDAGRYERIAQVLLSEACAERFSRIAPSFGVAQARQMCVSEFLGSEYGDLMRLPNDILAAEYAKAVEHFGVHLVLCPFPRIGVAEDADFLGATDIRQTCHTMGFEAILPHLPSEVTVGFQRAWSKGHYAAPDALANLLFSYIRLLDSPTDTVDGGDGVLYRLMRCARETASAEEMYRLAATKKYTNARFRRAALMSICGISQDMLTQRPRTTRVLAANARGRAHLAHIRHSAEISILTKAAAIENLSSDAAAQYARVCAADRLYTMTMRQIPSAGIFLKRTPYMEK